MLDSKHFSSLLYIMIAFSTFFCILNIVLIKEKVSALESSSFKIEFEPNWKSLDGRVLPQWYDDAKIGIFIHWGVYSVPSYGDAERSTSEWLWYKWRTMKDKDLIELLNKMCPKEFTYQDFAKDFTAELFNSTEWAELFKNAGAKYVVLTSKHHEGYTLWPSKYSYSWNSVDVGPHKDIVGELSRAVKTAGLEFGTYYSLFEWFNPMYLSDQANNYTTKEFVYNKFLPELTSLVENYKPSILWMDGFNEGNDVYWNSTYFISWLYNKSPVKDHVVVNDRWGRHCCLCRHGDFHTCHDNYNPGVLQEHKWEDTINIDRRSWGFRRNARTADYRSTYEILRATVKAVSCGGNMLINIGPTKDGTILPIVQERLLELGEWLKLNGEAVYGSQSWKHQNDTSVQDIWYTTREKSVYAFVLKWPRKNTVILYLATELFRNPKTEVTLLESGEALSWALNGTQVNIYFPNKATVRNDLAWVVKITPTE